MKTPHSETGSMSQKALAGIVT